MDNYEVHPVFKTDSAAHKGIISSLDIQNQSELLASGGTDGHILIRNLQTGTDTESRGSSQTTVDSLCFTSPTTLLSSQSGYAYLWDLKIPDRTPAMTFKPKSTRNCKLWSLDKHPSQSYRMAATDNRGSVSVWDARNPALTLSATKHAGNVWRLAFLPFAPTVITTCGEDGKIITLEEKLSQLRTETWSENPEGLNDFGFLGNTLIATTESESFLFLYDFMGTLEANF